MTTPVELRRLLHGFDIADRPISPPFGTYYLDLGADTLSQWNGETWETVGGSGAGSTALSDKETGKPDFVRPGSSVGLSLGGGGGVAPAPHIPGVDPAGGLTSAAPVTFSVQDTGGGFVGVGAFNLALALPGTQEQTMQSGVATLPATTTYAVVQVFTITAAAGVTIRFKSGGVTFLALIPGGTVATQFTWGPTDIPSGALSITGEDPAGVDAPSWAYEYIVLDVLP